MTEPGTPYAPPSYPVSGGRVVRRSMVLRHLAGIVFALVATPVGLLVLDYGAGEYVRRRVVSLDTDGSGAHIALMFLGAAILMVVAASARLSGLGPVLAGLVWGLAPLVWFMADLAGFFELTRDLPSTHLWFADPPVLFAPVAALLVGAGVAGRWRGREIPTPSGPSGHGSAPGWQ